MARKPYTMYKRGKIWQVQFNNSDGTSGYQRSSGCTNKAEAEQWAVSQISDGGVLPIGKSPTFVQFATGFFSYNGEWATNKKIAGRKISERRCIELTNLINKHILPRIGQLKIADISRQTLTDFRNELYAAGYAGAYINNSLNTIDIIMRSAEEHGIIRGVPKCEKCSSKPVKDRGILTPAEVTKLFSASATWDNNMSRTACLLAVTTGLRFGEILGLTIGDLHLDEGYLVCRRSWERRLRKLNETTKNGRARNIILSGTVINALTDLVSNNPHTPLSNESFVFYGSERKAPVRQRIITVSFHAALHSIGISESERQQRNIVFHSFRHYLNSLLVNAKIPLQKIQSITGHLSPEMTQRYYHVDDMSDVREVQNQITND